MVVRSKYLGTPISGMLVQPFDLRLPDPSVPIANQQVIEDQSGNSVVRVPPTGNRGWHTEGVPGIRQQSPGSFISPASEVEIGPKYDDVVMHGTEQVASLHRSASGTQPAMPRRPSWVQMGTDQPDPDGAEGHRGRYRNPSL